MADFKQSREEQRKPFGELTVKLDVDASDAIRALKALQREARKATQALRELESYYESEGKRFYTKWKQQGEEVFDVQTIVISDIPTSILKRELAQREHFVEIDEAAKAKLHEQIIKSPTNITINVPEIKVDDKANVEKIAKELVDNVFEKLEREQYRDFIERESSERKGNS